MAPNSASNQTGVLFESDQLAVEAEDTRENKPGSRKLVIYWDNVAKFVVLHLFALYGIYLMFTSAKFLTTLWGYFLYECGGLGITAGVHRLWSHRAYKANFPLRLLLVIFNTIANQNSVIDWARDHRVHHKYSETDADPHNRARGFFFAHVGWLLSSKHPEVAAKGKQMDFSDLYNDPLLVFQKKHYRILATMISFVIPTVIPVLCWNETWINSICVASALRYAVTLNFTWLVNSAAHTWGNKPYNKNIKPVENFSVAVVSLGEGWHNFHHTFPWDYKGSELGSYLLNPSTAFIDFFAKIGWASDMKTVSTEFVKKRVEVTGDGSHPIWGWGDKDQAQSERDDAVIVNKTKEA